MKGGIVRQAALNASGTALYIAGVGTFLQNAGKVFGENTPDTWLTPIAMISLFVFSAALTAYLMLGKPVLWYLDGRKKDAVSLFQWTLLIFFGITLAAFVGLLLTR